MQEEVFHEQQELQRYNKVEQVQMKNSALANMIFNIIDFMILVKFINIE